MSKNNKRKKCAVPVKSGPVVSSPVKLPDVSSELFKLYVARVGQMDIMHSMWTDKRGMFSHALDEARIAYDVYAEQSRVKTSIR